MRVIIKMSTSKIDLYLLWKGEFYMEDEKKIKLGIGFATGRKSFQKVLKTYVYNWLESGLTENINVKLNLLVAYDLKYSNTKSSDYTNIAKDVLEKIDETYFIGNGTVRKEMEILAEKKILNENEIRLFTGGGYAAKRNAVLYSAIKNNIDYLMFFDDDEYPMAVTKTRATAVWGGQHVLNTHLINIQNADITHGHHCGYISPIPYMEFNEIMTKSDFRLFIEAISNDIVSWDTIMSVMKNGGVTYADTKVLVSDDPTEVEEINHAKFISGANLCINLTDPSQVRPFYNPPGARGEDTFLSTMLSDHKVLRVPCYTFHDGFSTYHHLMDGVLPINLKYIQADSPEIVERFYKACIGWIRYKPLLLYITQRETYEEKIAEIRERLIATLPIVCAYFGRDDFMNILGELKKYHNNVKKHHKQYMEIQTVWTKITDFLTEKQMSQA